MLAHGALMGQATRSPRRVWPCAAVAPGGHVLPGVDFRGGFQKVSIEPI